jgi:hypothetical protein
MARLQGFKRIDSENVPKEQRQFAETVGYSVNVFADEVVDAFNNKRISFDNLNQRLVTFKANVDATGIPQQEILLNPGVTDFRGLVVISAISNIGFGNPTGAPFLTFQRMNNGAFRVTHITGLPADTDFSVTAIVIGA